MSNSDRMCWATVLFYDALLCLSLVTFLHGPFAFALDLNGLFQLVGPTIGTLLLVVTLGFQMQKGRISRTSGFLAIASLIVISFLCLALTMPIFMGI
jgi:hypothetical protein